MTCISAVFMLGQGFLSKRIQIIANPHTMPYLVQGQTQKAFWRVISLALRRQWNLERILAKICTGLGTEKGELIDTHVFSLALQQCLERLDAGQGKIIV